MPLLDPGRAQDHRRAAVAGVGGQRLDRRARGVLQGRLQHQVLGRIADHDELGEHHEIGAGRGGPGAEAADPLEVARDVADGRVGLGDRDGQFGAHGGSGSLG